MKLALSDTSDACSTEEARAAASPLALEATTVREPGGHEEPRMVEVALIAECDSVRETGARRGRTGIAHRSRIPGCG